ncbi:MAG: FkbM family methyltransferase [bacterium]|nr:FkbM family methyltransferase [bacterium]
MLNSQTFCEYELIQEASAIHYLASKREYDIVVYGGGSRGRIIIRWLRTEGVEPLCIVDQNPSKNHCILDGVPIYTPESFLEKAFPRKLFAVIATTAFQSGIENIKIVETLNKMGIHDYMSPHQADNGFPSYGTKWITWYLDHKKELLESCSLMTDEESVENFAEHVRVKLEHSHWDKKQLSPKDKYWGTENGKKDLYTHLTDECILDCGSSVGDSIIKYLDKGFAFEKIYAVEGNSDALSRMNTLFRYVSEDVRDKIEQFNMYIGTEDTERDTRLDVMFKDKKVTLIKMDIEGAELSVLKGGRELLSTKKPVLAICVYHKPEDLVEIPQFIHSCCPEYRLYLRKYRDHARSPRGEYELVLYAIPQNRV